MNRHQNGGGGKDGGVIALHALAFIAGGTLVVWVLYSALVTVVLPRGESVTLTRFIFIAWRTVFVFFANRARIECRRPLLGSL